MIHLTQKCTKNFVENALWRSIMHIQLNPLFLFSIMLQMTIRGFVSQIYGLFCPLLAKLVGIMCLNLTKNSRRFNLNDSLVLQFIKGFDSVDGRLLSKALFEALVFQIWKIAAPWFYKLQDTDRWKLIKSLLNIASGRIFMALI